MNKAKIVSSLLNVLAQLGYASQHQTNGAIVLFPAEQTLVDDIKEVTEKLRTGGFTIDFSGLEKLEAELPSKGAPALGTKPKRKKRSKRRTDTLASRVEPLVKGIVCGQTMILDVFPDLTHQQFHSAVTNACRAVYGQRYCTSKSDIQAKTIHIYRYTVAERNANEKAYAQRAKERGLVKA